MQRLVSWLRKLGPGILFASMAVGTSHLVLSTKAGAQYGALMIVPILLANLLKYPFFEFGVRYTGATGTSLIQGYLRMGRPYLWFYALITLLNAISIPAVLYLISGQLLAFLLGIPDSLTVELTLLQMAVITAVLIVGRYGFLERSLKILVGLLLFILLYAAAKALISGPTYPEQVWKDPDWGSSGAHWLFLMSLIGWMPTAIEAAAWVSMWNIEKRKGKNYVFKEKETLAEFGLGYLLTAVLAVLFFFMGWWVLYGSGTDFALSGASFSRQFANLYSQQLGSEFRILIALAAFATMLSSAMTAHDALGRVSVECDKLLRNTKGPGLVGGPLRVTPSLLAIGLINMAVIYWFSSDIGTLITVATFISFVFAPFLGWLNLKAVTQSWVPMKSQPKRLSLLWAWIGIGVMGLLSLGYLVNLFVPMN